MQNIKSIILVLFITSFFIACGSEHKHEDMNHETHMNENHEHQMKDADNSSSELVREGTIDVESLDTNNDGSLYECPMDWNVLDDKDGSCPVCGMDLKEYSIAEVKANLDKYGYQYKK